MNTDREIKMSDEEAKAELEIWRYVFGFSDLAAVKCAIELGIADTIDANGHPMTLAELSDALGLQPSPLHRIMRLLVQRRVFGEKRDEAGQPSYVLTPISHRLLKRVDGSKVALLLFHSDSDMLLPMHSLTAHIQGDQRLPFEIVFGEHEWSYMDKHPVQRELLNNAMACNAQTVVPAIVGGCPGLFEGVSTVVDVGGGNGTAMRTLVKACPWIKAINFDLPLVVGGAPECNGVVHVGGDMFAAIPKADVVFIKWVLHDWGDEDCIKILRKCKEAIPADKGKVIIVEAVLTEDAEEGGLRDARLMLDLFMLAHTKGKERTEAEWKNIITSTGFREYTIKPIPAIQSVIEVFP
ncbi:acetylserotonin O-methyltransferase-like [Magnolia sinica]|uniref:acetylserotonin O-methyltransferase-like n=1 Tax=Magnolia sinica TaxID=86752 RepID=UPI0026585DFD|nr:acetylserotonin O-methyltransferase-like [Magnolia sinica]